MKRPSRLDYAYAVGRVRALEKNLVERAVFSEASEEQDLLGALKVIFDAGNFPEDMVKLKTSEELDEFISREEKALYRIAEDILLEREILKILSEENRPEAVFPLARRTGYSFIVDYIRHKLDLANLKLFCRLKYSGLPQEKFKELVLVGGFLDEKIWLQNFDLSFGEMGDRLQATPYQDLWNRGTDALGERETFVELERGIEDFMMMHLRKASYIVFGPEPIFAYTLAKRRELKLVRLLGVGKLNDIPVDIIKGRISETYV